MEVAVSFDAIVLCGGASRRMGTDKALLALGGKTFLERAVAAVADAERIVLVGPQREVADGRCLWTLEKPPGGGPVAALAQGLRLITADTAVVLAIDHPLVEPTTIQRLVSVATGHDGAIVVDPEGNDQPLVGVYRAIRLNDRLKEVRAVQGAALKAVIEGLDLARLEEDRAARDCDTPEDLASLESGHSDQRGDPFSSR